MWLLKVFLIVKNIIKADNEYLYDNKNLADKSYENFKKVFREYFKDWDCNTWDNKDRYCYLEAKLMSRYNHSKISLKYLNIKKDIFETDTVKRFIEPYKEIKINEKELEMDS